MSDSSFAVVMLLVYAWVVFAIPVSHCLPRHRTRDVSTSPGRAADDVITVEALQNLTGAAGLCSIHDEGMGRTWMVKYYDPHASRVISQDTEAKWKYATNITDENMKEKVDSHLRLTQWKAKIAVEVRKFDWENFENATIQRQFRFAADIGTAGMKNKTKLKEMEALESRMTEIHSTASVSLDGQDLHLDPDLTAIMATSRDYDRLLKVWEGWRKASGRPLKDLYQQFVPLSNLATCDLVAGCMDTGAYWRSSYESPTFQKDVEALMDQLTPLYQQLHAYVRKRLVVQYGEDKFPKTRHIPAHLLGSMWGQTWSNIYDLVQPHHDRPPINVTAAMVQKKLSALQMFQMAETFFKSLRFPTLPQSFWNDSMLVKPTDRSVVCDASAWDFYNAKDFRIAMCTSVNQRDLVQAHREMARTYYQMEYSHLPIVFRHGANHGFQDAVADAIALSVSTPAHLRKIGLLEAGDDNDKDEINFLLQMALEKIAFLPFSYLTDQWRWSVFAGNITPDHYNHKWWELRCRYQGMNPPVARSAEDFDPGSEFHVAKNVPFIRYFVAHVLQFQFYQALCNAANHTGPLHQCDIFESESAGQLLRSMMRKGSSIPWPDVLEEMTGNRTMDAGAILDYFRPLQQWLEKENDQKDLGWEQECPTDKQ